MSEQVVMRKELLRESGRQMLVSLVLYGVLFGVLFVVEVVCPSLRGTLLQWSNAAFVVGIPASVIGTAYVLTIRNPKNYIGFYGDIVMAVLLAVQFWLQGSLDLTLLYLAVFVPFGIITLLNWRSNTLHPALQSEPFAPRWLPRGARWLSVLAALVIVALDYVLATLWIQHNGFGENVLQKLMGGVMIASSVLANVLLIRQRIDAWVWWVVYSLSGMVLYVLLGNMFSLVLFVVFLVVNGSTGWTWIRRYGMCK